MSAAFQLLAVFAPIALTLDFANYMTHGRPLFFPSKNLSIFRAVAFLLSFFVIAIVIAQGVQNLLGFIPDQWGDVDMLAGEFVPLRITVAQVLGYFGSLALHGYGLHLFIRRRKWITKEQFFAPPI